MSCVFMTLRDDCNLKLLRISLRLKKNNIKCCFRCEDIVNV